MGDRRRAQLQRKAAAQLEAAPGLPGVEADPRPTWAAFSACFTPRAVVRQGLIRLLRCWPVRAGAVVVDLGAGGGVFGQVWRELEAEGLVPRAYLVAVEPRESEAANLRRYYDEVQVLDADAFAREWAERNPARPVDLVIGNPPWDLFGQCIDCVWPLLAHGAILAMLGPSQWGHSDEGAERADLFDRIRPIAQWRVRGRIAFTGGAGHQSKCSWWTFRRGVSDVPTLDGWPPEGMAEARANGLLPGDPIPWPTLTLPQLTKPELTWRLRPGTD